MAKPVVVGISGGVDSAVAAALLKKQGHDVVAVFMKNWEEEGDDGVCTVQEDYDMVRGVCQKLNIPYYTANFTREYRDRVFSDFLRELEAGRTPNPDVLCNREIKFKAFLDMAMQLDAQNLATGHYAQLGFDKQGRRTLLRGADPNKDQSYFLYMLSQPALSKALFPVGHMYKSDVRAIAAELGLPNATRKDSTGICFIGERNFSRFLSEHLTSKSGNIVNTDGKVLGRHDGLIFYTIGQRKGLNVGGKPEPLFVIATDVDRNTIYVGMGDRHPGLYRRGLRIRPEEMHWVRPDLAPQNGDTSMREYLVRIRYRQPLQKAVLHIDDNGWGMIDFAEPQRGITAGQFAAWYAPDGELVGSGVIDA
ncbi:tRNA 2-thiouridine(34) synthase MnmA [uncultured Rikenella sp.]|uniref:tRNA 2-thiouridine(34) synthase MnmA n=1 Tax=uncultured Rikenella sp. TaxID=368003 RepID=UPI00261D1614|nr:tRNA 2-thiouridine(34) synthase MnmA [uncultured Rikenella sp.]